MSPFLGEELLSAATIDFVGFTVPVEHRGKFTQLLHERSGADVDVNYDKISRQDVDFYVWLTISGDDAAIQSFQEDLDLLLEEIFA